MLANGHILIVDDELSNLLLLGQILEQHRYQVTQAASAAEALAQIQAAPPDLLLCDIMMPQVDGYSLCQHLKADPATRHIPVIFLSALADSDAILRAFEVGGADYIPKPFHVKEVLARVARQLTLLQQQQELAHLRALDDQQQALLQELRAGVPTQDFRSLVMNHLELLEQAGSQHQDTLRHVLMGLVAGITEVDQMVMDVLDFVELEAGASFDWQPTHLGAFLQESAPALTALVEGAGGTLSLSLDDDARPLMLDSGQMQQMLRHLLQYSLYLTQGAPRLHLSAACNDAGVQIDLLAEGCSLSAEDVQHLFDAFYYARSAQERSGTGLELAIARAIVENHGGSLRVSSEAGMPLRFTVTL